MTPSTESALREIRVATECVAKTIFVPSANASAKATIATAEGLLTGIREVLVQRIGAARAFEVIAKHADILDRTLLDGQRPTKPINSCGNED